MNKKQQIGQQGIAGTKTRLVTAENPFACLHYPTLADHPDSVCASLEACIQKRGPMTLTKVMDVFNPVFEALTTFHRSGKGREDISPRTLFLRDSELFLSEPCEKGTDAERCEVLKRGFASPESYFSSTPAGPGADVYSLSAVICYCLSGVQPPAAPDRAISDDPDEFAAGLRISGLQKEVLLKGMAMQLSRRIRSVSELQAELATSLAAQLQEPPKKAPTARAECSMEQLLCLAQQGDTDAQYRLGLRLLKGNGIPRDIRKAVSWFQKAGEQGNASAQCELGNCYADGKGLPVDKPEAVRWYRKAAAQGNARAQNHLGSCLMAGVGCIEDRSEAVGWYRSAAELGLAEAQYNLGRCFDAGTGVPADTQEAEKWYRRAAAQGHLGAQNHLSRSVR